MAPTVDGTGALLIDRQLKRPHDRRSIDNVDTENEMRVTVKKWGNSASVRIPAAVMDAAKVRLDQAVDIREERGRIVIEPVRKPAYNLDDMISGITDENRHGEVDFGRAVGNEIL